MKRWWVGVLCRLYSDDLRRVMELMIIRDVARIGVVLTPAYIPTVFLRLGNHLLMEI